MAGNLKLVRLVVSASLLATVMVAAGSTPAQALPAANTIKSAFGSNVEGWTVIGDTTSSIPTRVATGGNPGGFAQTVDQAVGGVMFWRAPAKFLGNRAAWYEGSLRFDLQQSLTDTQFEDNDVIITGNGVTLTLVTSPNPGTTWTHSSVGLSEAAGWMVGGVPATEAQVRSALGNMTDLRIRGEFRTGDDTDGLDNVVLVPGPQASITSKSTTETDALSQVLLKISLSAASAHPVTVSYGTVADTAMAGDDYTHTASSVTFTPGQKSKMVAVTIVGDDVAEPSERLFVAISSATVGVKGKAKGTITILDDD
jgi:uncharacterized Zn-binding protein involved in type VI secretion